MDMSESSFLECFLLFFIGRHYTLCHSLQCAPNITLLVLQKQCSNCALWDEYKHHKRVAQKASLHFSMEDIFLLDAGHCLPITIPLQNPQRRTFKVGNVVSALTLWTEWTCQRAVSSSVFFCFLLDDISLFAIVFNVLRIPLFWFYRNAIMVTSTSAGGLMQP